jgi:hypothetical protein
MIKNIRRKSPATVSGALMAQAGNLATPSVRGLGAMVGQVLANESLTEMQINEVSTASNSLQSLSTDLLKSVMATEGFENHASFKALNQTAAIGAAMLASNPEAYLNGVAKRGNLMASESHQDGEFVETIPATMFGGQVLRGKAVAAAEAFDEKAISETIKSSWAYNLQASRQNEAGEAAFPTILLSHDQIGLEMTMRMTEVFSRYNRKADGSYEDNMGRKHILQAYIDHTLLTNDSTDSVPVYKTDTASNFVAPALIAPTQVKVGTDTFDTSWLAFGKKFDHIAIAARASHLKTGTLDHTDAFDPAIRLDGILLQLDNDDLIAFNGLQYEPSAHFVAKTQGNYREMVLQYSTKNLALDKTTKNTAGVAPAALPTATIGDLIVRLELEVNGTMDTESGVGSFQPHQVRVYSIEDAQGVAVPASDARHQPIVDLFATAKAIGYKLKTKLINTNRREEGQLINTTRFTSVYDVPVLAPITAPRALSAADITDASDIESLVQTTHARSSNDAITRIFEAEEYLKNAKIVNGRSNAKDNRIFGPGRVLVSAFQLFEPLDLTTSIDSLKSHERLQDLRAVLVNKIHNLAVRANTESGYGIAAEAMGLDPKATEVVVITDPTIANYLQILGDPRLLGDNLTIRVAISYDARMRGKIRCFLNRPEARNGQYHPLGCGFMGFRPELTYVTNVPRNGALVKEITVSPSWLHVVNLPIMFGLDVTGLAEIVAGKVAVATIP